MTIDFSSQVLLTVNSTTALTVNSAGRMSIPLQPAFAAQSGPATAVGGKVIPGTVTFNIGNCYNTADGRFTAPITGIYHFKWHQLLPNAGSGRHDAAFYKNGALFSGTRFILNKEAASTFRTIRVEAHINLAANDFVEVYYLSGAAALWADANYGTFSGYLIG
jgi:hypothetical protein